MNLIEDIFNLVKDDKEHRLEIKVDNMFVTVYLYYDPEYDYKEDAIIPIVYDTLTNFAYIPNDEYREKYNIDSYGIDKNEIEMIYKIMDYLESHGDEISKMCDRMSLSLEVK